MGSQHLRKSRRRWIVICAKIIGITVCLGALLLALQFLRIPRTLGFGVLGAMDRARDAGREGDLDVAMYWANVAVKRGGHTHLGEPYYLRGRIHEVRGELRKAIEDYTQAISCDEKDSASYVARGRVYEKLGNLDAAVKNYCHQILANPNSKHCPQRCAEQRAERNGPDTLDEMIEVFDRAIAANPGDDSFRKARAILRSAWRCSPPLEGDRKRDTVF